MSGAVTASAAANRRELERPRLELSGPRLAMTFERLANGAEACGGIEQHVVALRAKSALFCRVLADSNAKGPDLQSFKSLCALVTTVRRRVNPYFEPRAYGAMRAAVAALIAGRDDTADTDSRMAAFRAAFPDDREHRWVHDLGAEILHNLDPERYPLMQRWVWDARANTGVIREIWHAGDGVDIDQVQITVPSSYATFLMLREELSQFLAENGVFRDVLWYVDLLTAQVYADYVSEQGGVYLRADFSQPTDPLLHLRRMLGLDGISENGRTRLKTTDGEALVVEPEKLS